MKAADYDERFVHFVVLFNTDEDYFECHEVMEELWLEEGRNAYYQGLLQAAVGLHHWRNGNYSGAVKLFDQAENKLARYADAVMGLNVRRLRDDIARCLGPLRAWVEGGGGAGHAGTTGGGNGEQDAAREKRTIAGAASPADSPGSPETGGAAAEPSCLPEAAGAASDSSGSPGADGAAAEPPAFDPFRIEVVDPELRRLAASMAEIPLEQRLHSDD